MNDDQIKYMANRFLSWRLPKDFKPDGGISFEPLGNKGTAYEYRSNPTGTNLFDASQSEAMVRYMLDGLPGAVPAQPTEKSKFIPEYKPPMQARMEMIRALGEASHKGSGSEDGFSKLLSLHTDFMARFGMFFENSSAEIERLKAREAELLEANNRYLERARAAEKALAEMSYQTLERVRHKERGETYIVSGRGRLQVDGDLNNIEVTVYRCEEDGKLWVSPSYEFNDGRLEALEPLTVRRFTTHDLGWVMALVDELGYAVERERKRKNADGSEGGAA